MENDVVDIAQVVKDELKAVEATLRTHVSDQVATKFTELNTGLTEIRTSLTTLQAAGTKPGAEEVQALETRLVAAEAEIRTITLQARSIPMSEAKATEEADAALFKGRFIANFPELQKRLREMRTIGDENTRALDSSLFVTGGKLSADTADRFIDYLIERQTALKRVNTRRMSNPQGHTDELTIARRKLRKAVEGVAPNVSDAIGTRRRTLNTVETIWAEDLTLTFLEDNIERRGAETHIARMLATQFGNDLNDLAWNGNEAEDSVGGTGPFLSINDGWIALMLADPNVVDVTPSGTVTNTDILASAFAGLPSDYKGLSDLAFFVPIGFAERYAEEVGRRETPLGDQVLVQGFPALRYFGNPVLPETHLYQENADKLVLTPLSNLYHGIQRNIMVDSEWRPRKRAIEFTITARNDYQYSTGVAIVLVHSIPAGNR